MLQNCGVGKKSRILSNLRLKNKIEDVFKEQNRLPGRCFQSERDHGKELKHQRLIVDDHQMLLVCSNWHRGISEHFPFLKIKVET